MLRKFVGQHDPAAVDLEGGLHESLAILGEVAFDHFGTERHLVEGKRFLCAFAGNGEEGCDAGGGPFDPVHEFLPAADLPLQPSSIILVEDGEVVQAVPAERRA